MRGLHNRMAVALCSVALLVAPVAAQVAPVQPTQPGQPAAAAPLSRSLPLRRDDGQSAPTAGWLPAASLFVILLAGAALVLGRRYVVSGRQAWTGAYRNDGIARLSSQPLTQQASVHAIRWGDEDLLLACTPQAVTVLARRPSPQADGAGR